jgi:regulatory protein YycH of two-component signal transduction system YycFG
VDATFIDAPKQRNSREENKVIKEGKTPENWKLPENIKPEEMTVEQKKLAHKVSQKDTDARWAKKNNREQSKIRARVEHVFGDMTNPM